MNRRKLFSSTAKAALAAAFGGSWLAEAGRAQTPVAGRQSLPIPQSKQSLVTPLDARDATAPPIRPLRAPDGAPNVVIVLIDDMGFGASSAYGGPCQMPIAERLATSGLKYTRFHTTALCSPTRAGAADRAQPSFGQHGRHQRARHGIPRLHLCPAGQRRARSRETLKLNGYNTAAFGKMHQTPVWETSASGPFDRWPTGDGFERFYGFLGGETNQWYPTLFEGHLAAPSRRTMPNYHFSEDMTSRAIAYMREQKAMTPDKPFFAYCRVRRAPRAAPGAEGVASRSYRGKFEQGWDRQREETFARQKELGRDPARTLS